MGCVAVEAQDAVLSIPLFVPGLDVSGFDEAKLAGLLADVRIAQRCLDGLVMRIGVRSNELARSGQAAPTDETIRGTGSGAVGSRQARREAKRADAAESVDGLGAAVSKGEASGEHVDAISRHTSKLTDEQRHSIDFDGLIEKAKELPADVFDRLVKRAVDVARSDHGLADARAKREASEFRHWFDHKTGMGRFTGTLDAQRYEALTNAVDNHINALASLGTTSDPVVRNHNLAVEVLVQLVTASGALNSRSRLPSVTIVVDHDTVVHGAHPESVRQTENGHDVAPETISRLCCDATIRRVTLNDRGVPVNVGRKYRTATDAQWAALKAVHSGCAWDGCSAPMNWCEAHHIREWEHGGPTDLDNLVPLCSRHHHRVHEGQWGIKMGAGSDPDRTLRIYKPDGSLATTVPPPMRR